MRTIVKENIQERIKWEYCTIEYTLEKRIKIVVDWCYNNFVTVIIIPIIVTIISLAISYRISIFVRINGLDRFASSTGWYVHNIP